MRLTLVKCLSVLVASGHGERCNEMRARLKDILLLKDSKTGISKWRIHKFGKEDESIKYDYYRVGSEVYKNIVPLLRDIPEH